MTIESLKQRLLFDPETKKYYDDLAPEFNKFLQGIKERKVTQHYLVKYQSDWADEIYIYGLDLLTNVDKIWFESLKPTNDKPLVHRVGTNKDIEYTSASRFQEAYTWIPITVEEREVLKKLIGTDYGHFFYPYEDEDEDDTEEEEW